MSGKDVLHFLALGSRLELDILLESMKTKSTNIILSKLVHKGLVHIEVETVTKLLTIFVTELSLPYTSFEQF